mmetsp:Transcript_5710/g.10789  ORF Transcript_5710/g.10789 Transcript_5710/m.10789 type:complete len:368 (+) Transcript_5710:93-1196(+)
MKAWLGFLILPVLSVASDRDVHQRQARNKKVIGGRKIAPFGLQPLDRDPVGVIQYSPVTARVQAGDLPAKVDLRPFMSEVEDQGHLNSCAANAVAGAYEYISTRAAKQTGDTAGDVSRLFIYYAGRKRDQALWGEDIKKAPKDQGTSLVGVLDAVLKKGSCLMQTWPYEESMVNKRPHEQAFTEAQRYRVAGAMRVPLDETSMKSCLADGYPIIFGLKLTEAFFRTGRSGTVRTPDVNDPRSAEHGLHAMLLVGYNERKRVFIVRNSWSTHWGAWGYGYLPFDYVANPEFNMGSMFALKSLTDVDLTPADDDGEDPELHDDMDEVEVEDHEDDEEADEDDILTGLQDLFDDVWDALKDFWHHFKEEL